MREKWFQHSPSTNLITHATKGKNSGFVILRHQTLPLPGPNMDSISERIKGPGSFPVGFATWHMIHMPDHMPLKDSIWYSVVFFFFVFAKLLVQFSDFILMIMTKEKKHLCWRWMHSCLETVSRLNQLKPWFTLVSESGNSNMWYWQESPEPSWNISLYIHYRCIQFFKKPHGRIPSGYVCSVS